MATAEKFLAKLKKLYPQTSAEIGLQSAEFVWAAFEKNSNMSKPDNIPAIAADFRDVYYLCFQRVCSHYKSDDVDKLFLAYFPIIDFNAKANTTVNKDKIIIYDEYLNAFLIEFILLFMHLSQNDELNEAEKKKCKDFFEFNLLFFKNRKKTDADKLEEYLDFFDVLAGKDYDYMFWSAVGHKAIFHFIIAHELGHHDLGHTIKKEMQFLGFHESEKVEIDTFQHQQEFEADEYGFEVFLKIVDDIRENDDTNISGYFDRFPILYLDVMEFYYDYLISKGLINEPPNSHPLPKLRKERLLNKYGSFLSKDGVIFYDVIKGKLDSLREELIA